jgi:hypothetical protein
MGIIISYYKTMMKTIFLKKYPESGFQNKLVLSLDLLVVTPISCPHSVSINSCTSGTILLLGRMNSPGHSPQ